MRARAGSEDQWYPLEEETSWVNGAGCNSNTKDLYWFNSQNASDLEHSNLYLGKTDGGKTPKLILDQIEYPSDVHLDEEDDVVYFLQENEDLFKYELD